MNTTEKSPTEVSPRFRCSGRFSAAWVRCDFRTDDETAACDHHEATDHDVDDLVANPHMKDADCTVDPDTDLCVICDVHHGDPCGYCDGHGFHNEDRCPTACDGPCDEDDPCPKHCGRSLAVDEVTRG